MTALGNGAPGSWSASLVGSHPDLGVLSEPAVSAPFMGVLESDPQARGLSHSVLTIAPGYCHFLPKGKSEQKALDLLREFCDQGSDLPSLGLGSCPGQAFMRTAGWTCPALTQSLLDPDGLCHSRTLANPSLADRPDAKFILFSGLQPRNREPGREKFGPQRCPHC